MLRLALALALLTPASAAADTRVSAPGGDLVLKGDATGSAVSATLASTVATVEDIDHVLTAGTGCTAVDEHHLTCTVSEPEPTARLGAGDDAIVLAGTGWGEADLSGQRGDDLVAGGDGRDSVAGGDGADQLLGGAGNDFIDGDSDDTAFDGGAGNDLFFGVGSADLACGDGNDQVGIAYDVAPGPLFGSDCERSYSFEPRPRKVTAKAATFRVRCSDSGSCRSQLIMRWNGRIVARKRYTAKSNRFQLVELPFTPALSAALDDGVVLDMQIHNFRLETGEGSGERKLDQNWRVRVSSGAR